MNRLLFSTLLVPGANEKGHAGASHEKPKSTKPCLYLLQEETALKQISNVTPLTPPYYSELNGHMT